MAFQNLTWLYVAAPLIAVLFVVRFLRRHYWGHSLVEHFGDDIGQAHSIWRVPQFLELAALGLLLIALLGPVYPFTINRTERGGLQIMFVLDLSQSMEEPLEIPGRAGRPVQGILVASPAAPGLPPRESMLGTPGSRIQAIKTSALAFVAKRPGDAIGLVVFSNHGYLVSPATFDHESLAQYLLMTGTQTLVDEGYTGIGEGLGTANRFLEQQKGTSGRRAKGQVIVLFTDGDNNTGREPAIEIERARANGTRIYMIGIELHSDESRELAFAIPTTGGKYYDVRRPVDLERAMTDINAVEKGIFYTLTVTRNRPAYAGFVLLSLACLALRLILHAFPQFVEIS